MKIYIENETKFEFSDATIEKIANEYSSGDIELLIVDNAKMREINKNFRSIDSSTDVLSFPLKPINHAPLGSIVINIDRALESIREFSHDIDDEISLMFIHGMLHLLGYDHETDNGEMREKEKEIIERYNLPKSLILRTERKS